MRRPSTIIHPAVSLLGAKWLYVMSDLEFWRLMPVFKAGITGQTPAQRKAEIQQSIYDSKGRRVRIYICVAVPVWGVERVEKAMHLAFDRFQSRAYAGTSGGTEWFWWRNVVVSAAVFYLPYSQCYPISHCLGWAALILLNPFPFDAVLCALLLWALQTGFVLSAVWVIWNVWLVVSSGYF